MLNYYLALFLLSISLTGFAATNSHLSSKENELTHYIISHQSEQINLLARLVNINSGTHNTAGVHQVGELLRPQFEQLGFTTYWVEEPKDLQRAATLIAERKGHSGKRLLLIGHLDTVFPSDSSFQHFKRQGDQATGPGVIDDKGGDVVLLFALKALHAEGALENTSITVILTGDEEDSGKPTTLSRKPLIAAAQHSDIALDFEWAITTNTATIARRGISNWKIETTGIAAHSSEIFQAKAGDGAIFELTRILNTMRTQLSNEKYLSFSPGLILGGMSTQLDKTETKGVASGKANVIARMAIAKGDLRYLTVSQKINSQKKIVEIVKQHLPETNSMITFEEGIPSMPPAANNKELLKQYSQASVDLGYGSVTELDPSLRGAGDISHIASIVNASLAGLGPVGDGAHSTNETLYLPSLTQQTERAAILINRLTH